MATVTVETGDRVALLIDSTDDIDYEVFYKDEDGVTIDITGFDFEWTFTIGGVTIAATVDNDRLVTDDLAGKITLHIEANATDDDDAVLPEGLGEHRLRITDPVVKTLIRGALTNDT